MKVIKVNTYEFKELSKESKENAIKEYKEKELENQLECDYEHFKYGAIEEIKELGFEDVDISYSLSYCQGDGLCFEGKIDLKKVLLIEEFKKTLTRDNLRKLNRYLKVDNVDIEIKHDRGHYYHECSTNINYESMNHYLYAYPTIEKLIIDIVDNKFKEYYVGICLEYRNKGYLVGEFYWEDKNLIELINNHEDIMFYEDGEISRL